MASASAAEREAKVSGSEVPSATKVMAVIASGMPSTQPKRAATSPMIAVTAPMQTSATTKVAFPPKKRVGGMHANSSFHGKER